MSRASVGMVIEKLLTDENLRIRFALDPDGDDRRAVFARFRSQHATRSTCFAGRMLRCGSWVTP